MTNSKQTEADRLANQLDYHREYDLGVTHTGIDEQAAAELRRQQAEIERLNEALTSVPDWASVAKEQPAPSQYGSPELQAMIVARAMEKNAAEQPAQRAWVNATTWRGLTVDEILYCVELENPKAIVEEVEAKLREKNGITRSKHDQ